MDIVAKHTPQTRCRFAIRRGDITPPVGIYHRMWGAAKHDVAAGVHRPLLATVAVFTPADEATPLAADTEQIIIALDHCILAEQEIRELQEAVTSVSDVPRESLLIVFSHTHAAGLMSRDRCELPGGELIPDYLREMNTTVARLVGEALSDLRAATIVYGTGQCGLAANRDLWDGEREQFVCGFNPAEPGDSTLLVARVDDLEGHCLATIVNYACHPTTLAWDNQLISPDYPGALRETVEQSTGGAPCLFLQGASGDLGPVEGFVGETEIADRNGRQVGYAALQVLMSLGPARQSYVYSGPVVSGATIGTWEHRPQASELFSAQEDWVLDRRELAIAYRSDLPSKDETQSALNEWIDREEQCRKRGAADEAAECRAMAERQRRLLHRLRMLPEGPSYPFQTMVARWGDAVWIAVQGEPYCELQVRLRAAFPDTPIVVMTLANAWGASYLPPARLYAEDLPAPVYQQSVAVLESRCLEILIDDLRRRIQTILQSPT